MVSGISPVIAGDSVVEQCLCERLLYEMAILPLELKSFGLKFLCKLNNSTTGCLSRCGCSLNSAWPLYCDRITYYAFLMEIRQETAFLFSKTIKE